MTQRLHPLKSPMLANTPKHCIPGAPCRQLQTLSVLMNLVTLVIIRLPETSSLSLALLVNFPAPSRRGYFC